MPTLRTVTPTRFVVQESPLRQGHAEKCWIRAPTKASHVIQTTKVQLVTRGFQTGVTQCLQRLTSLFQHLQ